MQDLFVRLRQIDDELRQAVKPPELVSVKLEALLTEYPELAPWFTEEIRTIITWLWHNPPNINSAHLMLEVITDQLNGRAIVYVNNDRANQQKPLVSIDHHHSLASAPSVEKSEPAQHSTRRSASRAKPWPRLAAISLAASLFFVIGTLGVSLWFSHRSQAQIPAQQVLVLACQSSGGDTYVPGLGLYHTTSDGTILVVGVQADTQGLCVTAAGRLVELTCFQVGGACATDVELRGLAGSAVPDATERRASALTP